jgi:hypothetical protein
LVADGLIDRRADINDDRVIMMSEWLEFGVADVPMLFKEAAKSQNANAEKATGDQPIARSQQRGAGTVRFISRGDADTSTQQPSLFDFTSKLRRKRQLVVLK